MKQKLLQSLNTLGIVPIHDIGIDEYGIPYFTMKMLKGETLSETIRKLREKDSGYRKKYTLNLIIQIFLKICDAVEYAHYKGILHLDLKPENIQISDFGEVIVLDWGLSKDIEENDNIKTNSDNKKKKIKGTPGYMAPEQVKGEEHLIDFHTDIYSLGVILYECLTLKQPFESHNMDWTLEDTAKGNFIPPRKTENKNFIPKPVEKIVLKCMSLSPENRYHTVSELKEDINLYLTAFPTKAERATWLKRFIYALRRNRILFSFIIIILFALMALQALWGIYQLKQTAEWSQKHFITPESNIQLAKDWTIQSGKWIVKDNGLQPLFPYLPEMENNIYFNQLLSGDVTLEFNAVFNPNISYGNSSFSVFFYINSFEKSKRSITILNKQETFVSLFKNGKPILYFPYKIEYGKNYRFKLTVENSWFKLYCNDKLIMLCWDLFASQGFFIGFGARECSFKLTDIALQELSIPELNSAIVVGDAALDLSLSTTGNTRKILFKKTLKYYMKILNDNMSLSESEEILKRLIIINLYLNNYTEADKYLAAIKHQTNLKEYSLLETIVTYHEKKYDQAYVLFSKLLVNKNNNQDVMSILRTLLFDPDVRVEDKDAQMLWKLCAEQQTECNLFMCQNANLSSMEFLNGLKYSKLNFANNKITSLSPLKDMRLEWLNFDNNKVSDISELSSMPLTHLSFSGNKVSDISPLKNIPLRYLNISNNPITDITQLGNFDKLEVLICENNNLSDVEALKGLPLKILILSGNKNLKDLNPLKNCKSLEVLLIPEHLNNTETLKDLPNLKYIGTSWHDKTKTLKPAIH